MLYIFDKYLSILPGKTSRVKEVLGQHGQRQPQSMLILLTDENAVKLIVWELSLNNSAGHDDILPKVVKSSINSVVPQLVSIFNKSLQCGIMPNEL